MKKNKANNNGSTTKQITVNMFFSVLVFALNLVISFCLTPYVTRHFGTEAYGFVKMADDFTSYAALLSVALNSMAIRFLMLEKERGNTVQAQKYFSSITLANVVLAGIMTIPAIICVISLDRFLDIPPVLVHEVKLTFAITFAGFLLNLFFTTYGNCYYLTNKLSIGSIGESIRAILRAIGVIVVFSLASPRISYLSLCTFIGIVFWIVYSFYFTRKLTPEFRFRFADFEWKKLREVLAAGIWNSITRLSQTFTSGLDLLLTNTMVGSLMMGYLSVAKTVPNLVVTFSATIAHVFVPNQMMLYARNDMEGLKQATKKAVKFMCLFVSIPNAILVTMGTEFFGLWVPGEPSRLINILAVLTIINTTITGPAQALYPIFTITNKIKQSSLVTIAQAVTSLLITFVLLKTTDLGVYAVVGVGLMGPLVVTLCYHIPFAAKYIGLPKRTFYPEVGFSLVSTVVLCAIGFGVNAVMDVGASWLMWFAGSCLTGILGLTINTMLIFNKEERTSFLQAVFSRVKKTRE